MLLDIGSGNIEEGEQHPHGFVLQDVDKHKNIDLVCDIRDLSKFIDKGQCRVIRSCHVLEHFSHLEIDDILQSLKPLLRAYGVLHTIVPDLKAQARNIIRNVDEYNIMVAIYGGQKDVFDYHKIGYTTNILEKVLTRNGFTIESMDETDIGWIDCKAVKGI